MNYTVVGFFNEKDEAQKAISKLKNDGFRDNQIDMSPYKTKGEYTNSDYDYDEDDNTSGFWDWLFGDDDDDRQRHSRIGSRTNLVTVYADDKSAAMKAASVLDSHGALDVDDYDHNLTTNQGRSNMNTAKMNTADSMNKTNMPNTSKNTDGKIEVMKEELHVGKRDVETGGVRVRSRVIEKPVKEDIRLREERVYMTRKPVNKKVSDSQAFQDETIEMTEHAEKAVVEKDARVVEEITLNKDVTTHDETINETVRETKVDVDEDLKNKNRNKI